MIDKDLRLTTLHIRFGNMFQPCRIIATLPLYLALEDLQ